MTEAQRKKRIEELLKAINSGMFSEEQAEKMRREVDDLRAYSKYFIFSEK